MLWSWGLRGKVHDSLESPEPPLVSKQWRKPPQQIQDPTLAGPCWSAGAVWSLLQMKYRNRSCKKIPNCSSRTLLWRFIRYFLTKEINKCSPVPPQLLCCVFNQAAGRDAPRVDLSTSLCSWDEAKTRSWCRGDTGLMPASKWPAEMMRHVWAN